MTRFVCERHPTLYVRDLGVKFVGGQVDVSDGKVVAALRKLPPELGVVEQQSTGKAAPRDKGEQ